MDGILTGVIIGAIGGAVGALSVERFFPAKFVPQPSCACGHHQCFHGDGVGCMKCSCKTYIGPKLDAVGRIIPEDQP